MFFERVGPYKKTKEKEMEDTMVKVRVSEAGGVFAEIELPANSTVEAALKKAGARIDVAKQIRVGMEEAELNDIVEHGDTIYVVPQIKGN
jgi:hypothetical protein